MTTEKPAAKTSTDEVLARLAKRVDAVGRPLPPPTALPPFSVADIRGAIPPHCFKRSAAWGFAYIARDLAGVAACVYAATHIDGAALPGWATAALWLVYVCACACPVWAPIRHMQTAMRAATRTRRGAS